MTAIPTMVNAHRPGSQLCFALRVHGAAAAAAGWAALRIADADAFVRLLDSSARECARITAGIWYLVAFAGAVPHTLCFTTIRAATLGDLVAIEALALNIACAIPASLPGRDSPKKAEIPIAFAGVLRSAAMERGERCCEDGHAPSTGHISVPIRPATGWTARPVSSARPWWRGYRLHVLGGGATVCTSLVRLQQHHPAHHRQNRFGP
jgi:hypothetical protein